jgi:hypothetical protein
MKYQQARVISSGFRSSLRSIAINRQNRLYAAGDSEVKVFDAEGRVRRRWSTAKPPSAVAVAENGSVWAGQAGQMEIFDGAGKLLGTWRDAAAGEVTAIGFYRDSVLAGDAKDRAILHYDRDRKLINTIGKDNPTRGFLIPNGTLDFHVDARGIIHAANPGKHRVERYTLDGKLLGHIGRFDGLDPEGFQGCCNPTNLAVSPSGWVYVTEKAGPRAKVLDAEGKLVAVIAESVFDAQSKNMPVAVDEHGSVYVADTVKRDIIVFEPV